MFTNKHFFFMMILGVLTVLFACSDGGQKTTSNSEDAEKTQHHSEPNSAESKEAIYYTCPMSEHKHISSNEPGRCTECQMELVAAVETTADSSDYYGCP